MGQQRVIGRRLFRVSAAFHPEPATRRVEGPMILRTWHGRTRLEDADAYETFLIATAAPDYGAVPGLRRAWFTRRDDGDAAHFLLVTLWADLAAVRAFAGADPARAKYYPEDDRYLLEQEAAALNHGVFFDSG